MNFHLTRSRLVRSLTPLFVLGFFVGSISGGIVYGENALGAELGTDLYKKVNSSYSTTKKALVGKRIIGVNTRINDRIKARCRGIGNTNVLIPGQDLTVDELAEVSAGNFNSLWKKVNPSLFEDNSTEILNCTQQTIQ